MIREKRRIHLGTLLFGGAVCGLWACSNLELSSPDSAAMPMEAKAEMEIAAAGSADMAPPSPSMRMKKMRPSKSKGRLGRGAGSAAAAAALDDIFGGSKDGPGQGFPADSQPAPVKRMVQYNGSIKLQATNPKEGVDRAVKLVKSVGGYVENLSGTTVTLRVPVAQFRSIFDKLLKFGDVLSRSVSAQDVTDAFTALDLRIRTLEASRDRLISLLARAKRENQKLRLLREIKRLTETIDRMNMQLTAMASLANFSRINLEIVPRLEHWEKPSDETVAAFRFIHRFSPFRRDVAETGKKFELEAPSGMVALDNDYMWIAESADAAVMWSARRINSPQGDTNFWLKAIKERLAPHYGSAESFEAGQFKVLRLMDGEGTIDNYRYLIAIHADGDELNIVEIYYPTAEQEQRYGEGAIASLSNKGGS